MDIGASIEYLQGGVEVPVALAPGQVRQQAEVPSPAADTAAKAAESPEQQPAIADD